ncbi:hypothetical protein TD95_001483 [Thielaviopsis punctulata]|uniref:Transcription factor CBF/NF-Y/archaeal histone domain-containing protein n=1 Tax=Thielaviopsis punctulata TaxID=72032 RepID=A0A0F4ZH32_9PEZI|nr:hypothetical protein TD95_001483 [Thielaviopsis punctulata]
MSSVKNAPRRTPTGQSQLPLSRVKRIIAVDPDIAACSASANFLITVAAELFVQHMGTEAHAATKLERKPRRNIQYKDVATAINHNDHLEFLEDTVPKTQPYKKIKDQAAATRAGINGDKHSEANGSRQKQLISGSGMLGLTSGSVNVVAEDPVDVVAEDVEMTG